MVEAYGILPRSEVAQEVKDLDQDARAALRKHGMRFGQFTIFMPLLLKPAPTRLRLVLWSLAKNLQEFPEAPPPGLVTVPSVKDAPEGYHTMCGYREAGERAIRIDMLERLADMLRAENSRAGFEAKPDMLSITGMTLEQFADLMGGLGYRAERGEREKVKPADKVMPDPVEASAGTGTEDETVSEDTPVMDRGDDAPAGGVVEAPETPAPADVVEETADIPEDGVAPIAEEKAEEPEVPAEIPEMSETEVAPGTAADAEIAGPETEVYFTFTWGRTPNQNARSKGPRGAGKAPQGKGKPRGKKPQGKGKPQSGGNYSARPPKNEKKIDPDNPFAAALMGLKDKK